MFNLQEKEESMTVVDALNTYREDEEENKDSPFAHSNTLVQTKKIINTLEQELINKYGVENRICHFQKMTSDELNMIYSGRLFCLHSWVQAVSFHGMRGGKTYLLIGLFGALICPTLDFFYDRNLIMESKNLWLYIGVQVALMFING